MFEQTFIKVKEIIPGKAYDFDQGYDYWFKVIKQQKKKQQHIHPNLSQRENSFGHIRYDYCYQDQVLQIFDINDQKIKTTYQQRLISQHYNPLNKRLIRKYERTYIDQQPLRLNYHLIVKIYQFEIDKYMYQIIIPIPNDKEPLSYYPIKVDDVLKEKKESFPPNTKFVIQLNDQDKIDPTSVLV